MVYIIPYLNNPVDGREVKPPRSNVGRQQNRPRSPHEVLVDLRPPRVLALAVQSHDRHARLQGAQELERKSNLPGWCRYIAVSTCSRSNSRSTHIPGTNKLTTHCCSRHTRIPRDCAGTVCATNTKIIHPTEYSIEARQKSEWEGSTRLHVYITKTKTFPTDKVQHVRYAAGHDNARAHT